jgi:F-type H+-transporting ATPase subunit epsilon
MPFVTVLRPGVVTVAFEREEHRVFVRGGFADVSVSGLSVLAEQAIPVEELGPSGLDDEIRLAEQILEAASTEDARRLAAERLAQMNELKQRLFG